MSRRVRLLPWGMFAFLLALSGCANLITPNLPLPTALDLENVSQAPDPVAEIKKSESVSKGVLFAQDNDPNPVQREKPKTSTPEAIADPKVAPVKAITLDMAINTTLIADPRIRSGFESINQANADLLTASLRPNPYIFADAQLLPLTRPFTVNETGGPPQADALLSYPIDWFLFGKRAANMAAAGLGVKVSQAAYQDLIRRRVTETAINFYDVLEAKALVQLAQQDVAYFEKTESVVRAAVAGGSRAEIDLKRIQLDLLNSKRAQREAELVLANARARLRALMGHDSTDPAFDIQGELRTNLTNEPVSSEQAYQLAVENRPDIQSDRLRVSEAAANVEVENRKAYPDVTPHFGVTRQFQSKSLGMPDANSYEIALTSTLPFSNRNQGNRSRAMSLLTQSRFDLQSSLVNLRAEIEQATQAFLTAYQNAALVGDAQLKLATEVRDTIKQAYDAGGSSLFDVLDTERNYRDTYRSYITGRANYWRSLYRLNSAVGKQVIH